MDNLLIFDLQDSKTPTILIKKLKDRFRFTYLKPINYFLSIKIENFFIRE